MKLSNKILIAFFGFILVYMCAAFVEIRFRGEDKRLGHTFNSLSETISLEQISFISVINVEKQITLKAANKNEIVIYSDLGDQSLNLKYELNGDSLIINGVDHSDEISDITIHVQPDRFKAVEVHNSTVYLKQFKNSTLAIRQNGGNINFNNNGPFKNLNITAFNKAKIVASNFSIDTLILNIDNSDIRLWSTAIKSLQGEMKNQSELRIKSPNDFQFKKDNASRLQILD